MADAVKKRGHKGFVTSDIQRIQAEVFSPNTGFQKAAPKTSFVLKSEQNGEYKKRAVSDQSFFC